MSAGKGDKPRPVDKKTFNENFDNISWKPSEKRKDSITKKSKITYKY